MIKVITYGTYDLLHYGHIRLLERAKALGDYLIVGVTADDFDKTRGKINVQQSLMERIEAVRATGLADEIIVEEYEGQKIDDIKRYNVDIFTVGSDWAGQFDYLNEYCKVVYLDRTQGVSSSDIRSEKSKIRLGLIGRCSIIEKYIREASFVNGIEITGVVINDNCIIEFDKDIKVFQLYEDMLNEVDAVYIVTNPSKHYEQIKVAINKGKHVLCEAPIALSSIECEELFELAQEKKCILMEGIKTAYSMAYHRLLLLLKGETIGSIVSVEATCTSLKDINDANIDESYNSICDWGPTAMLPVFQILGCNYESKRIISAYADMENSFDLFTKICFIYKNATASIIVGNGVKSEGELIISGTKGYAYVPAPWWKTDYFEIRFENTNENKRYFYQLDGEGIRYEIVTFLKSITSERNLTSISCDITYKMCSVIDDFENKKDLSIIKI